MSINHYDKNTFNECIDYSVLAGDSGNSLAFGTGQSNSTALTSTLGDASVSAHRDTHFQCFKTEKNGRISVQSEYGKKTL